MTFDRGAAYPADQTTVRRANLGVVLRHVATSGSRSRAQIAAETGLTRGTVSSLVSELIARDLLYETGETTVPRGIGRPGAALELPTSSSASGSRSTSTTSQSRSRT